MSSNDPRAKMIKVVVKARPLNEKEIRKGGAKCINSIPKDAKAINLKNDPKRKFEFDGIF